MKFTSRHWRLASLIVLGTLILGCSRDTKKQEPPPKLVTVAAVIQKDVPDVVMYTGNTKGRQTVEIKARVTGYLKEIKFEDGGYVTKNQELFVIDRRPYLASLKAAQAQLEAAVANEVKTKSEYDRNASLYKKDAVSKADVDITKGNWEVAKASIDQAKANVDSAQINYDFTILYAPFDGVVSRRFIDKENVVNADSTKLTDVIQFDPMYAYFNISEADSLRFLKEDIKKGQTRKFNKEDHPIELGRQDEPGYPHKGWVDFVNNELNAGTGTIQIRGVFPNPRPYELLPGLFVRIRAEVGVIKDALLIPDEAIGSDQRGSYVYVAVDKGGELLAETRRVDPGPLTGDLRAIKVGAKTTLQPGERVIVKGLLRVRPGDRVVIQPDEPPGDDAKKK